MVLPELDGATAEMRAGQSSTINAVLALVAQRADTLSAAASEVMALPPPDEALYTPMSAADAVIAYAGNFVPAWAGAISIDRVRRRSRGQGPHYWATRRRDSDLPIARRN